MGKFTDKYHLNKSQSLFLAEKGQIKNIYCGMKMENRTVTLDQTQSILNGINVPNVQLDDIQAILNMRDAWKFLLNTISETVTFEYWCKLNDYIARNEALEWGKLRTGNVEISGTDYVPPIPEKEKVIALNITENMSLLEKLTILSDAAKYDVACTSSGASRTARAGILGSCYAPGCCHAFTADGRCVSLLKVLMTNCCAFDCSYCVNRRSNDIPRATFTPRELAELTVEFYRRNYIEGLFLSSAVLGTPDYTTERMLAALRLLRGEYRFGGYIHAKAIPGTSPELLQQLGYLADRLSVNVELPSEQSLNLLAPDKGRHSIFRPMKQIAVSGAQSKQELTVYRHAPKFAPAGQSTQMIVGASPETDYHILKLTEGMYQKYSLKRVFYSAYIPVAEDTRLPALDTKPPLLREHRLYQADWLLRFYQFKADEILDEANQSFNPYLDPKCNWAVQHYGLFPVDVNRAPFEMLLRVPGIGPKSARRIWHARKLSSLGLDELKRMGVVLKRAQYFITCKGFAGAHPGRGTAGRERITQALIDPNVFGGSCEQLSLFTPPAVDDLITQGVAPRAAMRMVREEAVQCLAKAL